MCENCYEDYEERIRTLEARIHELEANRNCSQGACGKCGGCYEVMREEFNRAADERDELRKTVDRLCEEKAGEVKAYLESDGRNELRKAHERMMASDARVKLLETSIVGAIRELQNGKDYTPLRRLERALAGKTTNGAGQSHKRPDGVMCSYMAETFCNKCGWFANE